MPARGRHPAFQPPQDRGRLVAAEVDAAPLANPRQQRIEIVMYLAVGAAAVRQEIVEERPDPIEIGGDVDE